MKKLLVSCIFSLVFSLAAETMDIQTRDGRVFEDASLERVNPDGIDIGYVNDEGHYVLKGLLFKDLPEDLQKRFGYDPEKSKKFESEVKKYESKDIDKVADEEKTRLERITEQIKAKFSGEKITLKPADLRYAIHAWRRSVEITPVKDTKTGCVVKVNKVLSGKPIHSEFVLIDGVHLPGEGTWSGFLYPAGVQAVYEKKQIPVFTGNLDDSAELLTKYLEIYAEYAATGKEKNDVSNEAAETHAPDQADANSQQAAGETGSDIPAQWTDGDTVTYYPFGSYYGFTGDGVYFISGNFVPVAWWNRFHPDRPPHKPPPNRPSGKPHRPRPPAFRPDRPDRPSPPDHPDRPDRPSTPDRKPGTTTSQVVIRQPLRKESSTKPRIVIGKDSGTKSQQVVIRSTNREQNAQKVRSGEQTQSIIRAPKQDNVRRYEIRRNGAFRQAVPTGRRNR